MYPPTVQSVASNPFFNMSSGQIPPQFPLQVNFQFFSFSFSIFFLFSYVVSRLEQKSLKFSKAFELTSMHAFCFQFPSLVLFF